MGASLVSAARGHHTDTIFSYMRDDVGMSLISFTVCSHQQSQFYSLFASTINEPSKQLISAIFTHLCRLITSSLLACHKEPFHMA